MFRLQKIEFFQYRLKRKNVNLKTDKLTRIFSLNKLYIKHKQFYHSHTKRESLRVELFLTCSNFRKCPVRYKQYKWWDIRIFSGYLDQLVQNA